MVMNFFLQACARFGGDLLYFSNEAELQAFVSQLDNFGVPGREYFVSKLIEKHDANKRLMCEIQTDFTDNAVA